MSTKAVNRFVALKEYVPNEGKPSTNNFIMMENEKPKISGENQVLCETLYLSVDPYMRFCIMEEGHFKSFQLNKPVFGAGVGRVIESTHKIYSKGDILFTYNEWDWPGQEFVLLEGDKLSTKRRLDVDLDTKQLSLLVGILGMPGLTAYFGVERVVTPAKGEIFLVSGAAGAVGSIAGQLARLRGAIVCGITSTEEKANYLVKECGFDHAIVHGGTKSPESLCQEIKSRYPDGIDVYFDDVGGKISEIAISCLKDKGRIGICGQISRFNDANFQSLDDVPDESHKLIKSKHASKQFFLVNDFAKDYDEAFQCLYKHVKNGEIKYRETFAEGIDRWPESLISLFDGSGHWGKVVVCVKHEERCK